MRSLVSQHLDYICVFVTLCVCVRTGVCRCVQVCTSEVTEGRYSFIDPLISGLGRGEGARELQSTLGEKKTSVVESNEAKQEGIKEIKQVRK